MPIPDLTIRSAQPADVPLLLEFIRAIATYERRLPEVTATETSLHASLFGRQPAAEALIAEWAGEPAAYAVIYQSFSTFVGRPGLYLEDLYVKPGYRRRGIGRALLGHLASLAIARGCGRFEWTTLDWNESAQRFYDGLGAHAVKEWRLYRLAEKALTQLATHGTDEVDAREGTETGNRPSPVP